MALYRLNVSVVSRGKNQNAVAKSAYNSASKLKDYQEETEKDFRKKQCDYSEIITPDHAPELYKDREYLWNKVHSVEKRKDSRLAREFQLSLPTEFSKDDNIELAKKFANTLKEEGMIVDLNIHKLNSNNPHAHLLCTVRGIDENGEFEAKRIGNKKVRDWDNKEKLLEWRERWSKIQNEAFNEKGFNIEVSDKSYKERGIKLKPTITEGWKERKYFKKNGELSAKQKYNLEARKYNKNEIKKLADDNEKKLNKYNYITKDQLSKIASISKELGTYVSPNTLIEKSIYIDDLSSKSLLISDSDKRFKQEDKVEETQVLIDDAKSIFIAQADSFFEDNYDTKFEDISDDDKIFLTNHMLENNIILEPYQFEKIIEEKVEKEQLEKLNILLNNTEVSHENINKEKDFFLEKLNAVLKENNHDMSTIDNIKEDDFKDNDFNKVLYYSDRLERLATADNILEDYYDNKISKLFGDDADTIEAFKEVTDTKDKKDIIDFIEFYGEEKSLGMIDSGEFNYRFNEEERTELISNIFMVTDKLNTKFPTDYDNYLVNKTKSDMIEKYDVDITNGNDIKHILKESILNNDENIEENLARFTLKSEQYDYHFKPINFADIHRGINSMVYSFNEIFKDRMPKYQNQKAQNQVRPGTSNNRRNQSRNRGHGLT